MAEWDVIVCGYSAADETINFGTRAIGDCENLYETCTLASIKNSGEAECSAEPCINAVIKGGKLFFSVNKVFKVFENLQCSEVECEMAFEEIVDTFCVSDDTRFVLVCLGNGCAYGFLRGDEAKYLFVKSIMDNTSNNDSFFVASYVLPQEKDVKCWLVSKNGMLHCLLVKDILELANDDKADTDIDVYLELVVDFEHNITSSALNFPCLLVNGDLISIYNHETQNTISDESYNLKTVFPLYHLFIALQDTGELIYICSETLIIKTITTDNLFKDFVTSPHYNKEYQILAVTEPTETKPSQIQLISCFTFSIIFTLNLTSEVFLITPESVNDESIYISKVKQNDKLKELRFCVAYETSPEMRLERLLKRQCFKEAESFASMFGLDADIIRKARAQVIVDKTSCNTEDIDALLDLLESIKDKKFALNCCLGVHECCDRSEDVKRVLKYGSRNLPENLMNDIDTCALYETVSNFLFRFETYTAVLNCTGRAFDVKDWCQFSECDLMEEVIQRLRMSNIEESSILFSRLDRQTLKNNLESSIEDILETLSSLSLAEYVPFLHVFITVSLKMLPFVLPLFIRWLYNQIFHIEKLGTQDFPENMITFTNTVTKLLRTDSDSDISKEIQELTVLSDGLKQLRILKEDFRIRVPLEKYLEGPKMFIRTLLNIDMDSDVYSVFLQKYLHTFILNNNLIPDEIYFDEIRNIVQYEEEYWMQVVPYILECISAVDVKLKAILILIAAAKIPWAQTLFDISIKALSYSHPLVAEIRSKVENLPVKIIMHKYNCIPDTNKNFTLCVRRIVSENRSSMLQDIKKLCRTKAEIHRAHMILISNYLETGNLTEACEVLDEHHGRELFNLCSKIIQFITIVINNEFASVELQDNCHTFLEPVFNRLKKAAKANKCYADSVCTVDKEILNAAYRINKMFGIKIKTDCLQMKTLKDALVDDLLFEIVQEFQSENSDIIKCIETIRAVEQLLNMDPNSLLVNFCSKIADFDVVKKAAETVYETSTHSKNLCLFALLLFNDVGFSQQCFNQTIPDFSETSTFIQGLKLAERLSTKAILIADDQCVNSCVEVLRWMQTTCFMLSGQRCTIKEELYRDMFSSDLVVPAYSNFNALKDTFNLCTNYLKNYPNPNTKFLMYFNRGSPFLTEEEITEEVRCLPQTIAELGAQGQTLTAYKLALNFHNSLVYVKNINASCLEMLHGIIENQCIMQLLQQVVSARYIDCDLAYDLLLMMDVNKAVKFISDALYVYKRDVIRFEALANISYRILCYYKDKAKMEKVLTIMLKCKWWKRLNNCSILYDEFFMNTAEVLAEKLLQFKLLDDKLLEEFCEDFKLDLHTFRVMQLKLTLVYWKPVYTVTLEVNKKKKLSMESNEDSLVQDCMKILEKIENKDTLAEIINSLWTQINFYYYEVFDALFHLLRVLCKETDWCKKMQLLFLLKSYNRVNEPSEAEKGEWFTAFPDTQNLDPLSEFRLPFSLTLLTTDVWNIIRPEINLQTYKFWFGAVNILKGNLNRDEICCFVAKQVVASGLLKRCDDTKWDMYPKHEELFREIDVCMQNITDPKAAASAVYHLMTHTQHGADLVNAASLCHKYTLKYKEAYPDAVDIGRAYVKVQKQYLSYSAMHILHLNRLAETKYLDIVSEANLLIDTLYMDERIVKRTNSIILNFPDINKTVNELAELFKIDVFQKRLNLLNDWLSSSTEINLNSTVKFLPNCNLDNAEDVNCDNMKRAAYMCSGSDVVFWRDYLMKAGLDESHADCKNYIYRARALSCFCMITKPEDIFELTNIEKDELMNFIDKLSLISKLKYQGYQFDIETLDHLNKKQLIHRLLQNPIPSNIRIMAALCMTYNIHNLKYWKIIMKSANRSNMLQELEEYIRYLQSNIYCNHLQFYIDSWQKVIENMVSKCMVASSKETNLEMCVETLLYIQSCPVLYSLEFKGIVEKFILKRRPECAAILLQYLDDCDRESFAAEIYKQNDNILQLLNNLGKYGIWGITKATLYFTRTSNE